MRRTHSWTAVASVRVATERTEGRSGCTTGGGRVAAAVKPRTGAVLARSSCACSASASVAGGRRRPFHQPAVQHHRRGPLTAKLAHQPSDEAPGPWKPGDVWARVLPGAGEGFVVNAHQHHTVRRLRPAAELPEPPVVGQAVQRIHRRAEEGPPARRRRLLLSDKPGRRRRTDGHQRPQRGAEDGGLDQAEAKDAQRPARREGKERRGQALGGTGCAPTWPPRLGRAGRPARSGVAPGGPPATHFRTSARARARGRRRRGGPPPAPSPRAPPSLRFLGAAGRGFPKGHPGRGFVSP